MARLWEIRCGVAFAAALVLLLGCGGSNNHTETVNASVTISGTVTFTGYNLLKDTNGVPTGLDIAHPTASNPARAIMVRVIEGIVETRSDGTKTTVWSTLGSTSTDTSGKYSVTVPVGTMAYVEVVSTSNGLGLHVMADRITSTTPINDRFLYTLRKSPDGTDGSASNPTPALPVNANATVNFDIGLSTRWWLSPWNTNQASLAKLETTGSGSRIAAIIDTAYFFASTYGSPGLGAILNLHYQSGHSETRGSYIEYDRSKNPLESDGITNSGFDPSTGSIHYFGTLQGGPVNDDAFDQGVILPMLARNWMFARGYTSLFPPTSPLTDLSAELALVEGFPDAMAANVLKSPYLADTDASGTLLGARDVRNISSLSLSQKTPLSAPNIRALIWNLILKANAVTAPGTPDQWTAMNPSAIIRMFARIIPTDTTTTLQNDIPNLYSQLGRLQEALISGEPVDLAAIFTNSELTAQCASFNITWPRPAAPSPYASFMRDWGADPNTKVTAIPVITFNMSNAQMVNGSYPNISSGEVAYARFTLSLTRDYSLRIGPSLPSGASVEIQIQSTDGSYSYTRTFTSTNLGPVNPPNMLGNSSTPVMYLARVRLISPSTLQASSIPVTINLDAN